MEAIEEFLPDTNFVVSMRLFIYLAALYCDPTIDREDIRAKADPLARKLDNRLDYQIGNWCLLKYYELVEDTEGQTRVRKAAYEHNNGFMFLAAFEDLFINQRDERR